MKTELAIIGAGPAGMAAAETGVLQGLAVTVIDEQIAPGGQIYRQPPAGFNVPNWLRGRAYRQGKALLNRVSANEKVRWLLQSTVSGIMSSTVGGPFTLLISSKHGVRQLTANTVLIAPGCYDLPVIFPGWNLPGVMSAGGIQAFVKSQQFLPGKRFLFAGSHPLQLVVADQIIRAGGEVAGVLFVQGRVRAFELLKSPVVLLKNLDKLVQMAATLWRLRKAGVPVKFNHMLVQANGDDSLQSVTAAPIGPNGVIQA
ncbi:MAG: FAD-dependent oxidoreductase, partial [Lysobacterales bacterium]